MLAALEQSDRQVEAGRAVLALIVSVGAELEDGAGRMRVLDDVAHGAIDRRVAATAFLVSGSARISDARDDETVLDAVDARLVLRKPRNGADRSRGKHQAIRVLVAAPT